MVAYWQHWLCRKVPGGWAGAHIRVFFWKVCSYLRESFFLHKKIAKRSSWYNFLSTSREKNWSFSLKRFQILLKNLAYLGSKKELTQIWKLANTNFWQVSVSSGQKSAQKYPGFSTFSPVKSNRSWFLHSRGRRYYRNRSGIAIPKCLESVSESNLAHPWVSVSVSKSYLGFQYRFGIDFHPVYGIEYLITWFLYPLAYIPISQLLITDFNTNKSL